MYPVTLRASLTQVALKRMDAGKWQINQRQIKCYIHRPTNRNYFLKSIKSKSDKCAHRAVQSSKKQVRIFHCLWREGHSELNASKRPIPHAARHYYDALLWRYKTPRHFKWGRKTNSLKGQRRAIKPFTTAVLFCLKGGRHFERKCLSSLFMLQIWTMSEDVV